MRTKQTISLLVLDPRQMTKTKQKPVPMGLCRWRLLRCVQFTIDQ